ncbi:MAG: hypothetical protein NTV54_08585 [Ignavibacteriales bacterium]|nr:hypothetical protein [Ignavibacteriales bacterium]
MMKKRTDREKSQSKIGVVVTKESLIAMLNLCKGMADELMTLIDLIQDVANEELLKHSKNIERRKKG